ncbi:hypothetical protein GOP47_0015296 [Adiantum capillus-veneris]|uniref:Inward rectifier potassium channel C-terminal domain-containing protein n=1 Tax=Adiantum capillus-veneris TaxID=13818 RepID=A0A9D4ZD25_ADICA|nr:hypothetical protein GOP47_0015296 [Adiantum capillus-veneris]
MELTCPPLIPSGKRVSIRLVVLLAQRSAVSFLRSLSTADLHVKLFQRPFISCWQNGGQRGIFAIAACPSKLEQEKYGSLYVIVQSNQNWHDDVSRTDKQYFQEHSSAQKIAEANFYNKAREHATPIEKDESSMPDFVLLKTFCESSPGKIGTIVQNVPSGKIVNMEQDAPGISRSSTLAKQVNTSFAMDFTEVVGPSNKKGSLKTSKKISELFDGTPLVLRKTSVLSPHSKDSESIIRQSLEGSPSGLSTQESATATGDRVGLLLSTHEENSLSSKESSAFVSSKLNARNRWRRATHSITFMNRLAVSIRSAATDLIEDMAVEEMLQQQVSEDDAGGVGAATFEGATTVARSRSRGRKGMEGLLVRQNRGFITFLQDFYVACLKMPISLFLVGVFFAPLILGLLFTPLYLLDVDGLSFNGIVPEDATTNPLVSAKQRFLAFLNVFLYALSLSTTFGGAPVAAESPFCLLVANVNTLLAQFLFVFLSGAVFARMSQPSYPIRCSKKAIIKTDDLLPVLGLEQKEKYKVFAVRLVLTGPSPCELVDAKICLTFRIFVTLPSGSVFCSTQDLELVRPEVPYLRYGLMVRHIIDKKSPIYGHTLETLRQGDASLSLTVMGMERTSMQPVFHVEDYFVCDDDVMWEGDYEDFIHINEGGQRVLDHSRIDLLKPMKAAAIVSQAAVRMANLSNDRKKEREETGSKAGSKHPLWRANWPTLRKRTLFKSMSTSFTRAEW